MKNITAAIFLIALSGCSITNNEVSELSKKGYSADQIAEILNAKNITEEEVYSPAQGVQQDDSNYINEHNLNYISSFVNCQEEVYVTYQVVSPLGGPSSNKKVEPTRFIQEYMFHSYIDNNRKVKLRINRPNCKIDYSAIKNYLDKSIKENKIESANRIKHEIEFEQKNPENVFIVGCNAYLSFYKGIEYININDAVKKYPKMKEAYVRRLYIQGWNVAKSGVASSKTACEYYSQTSLVIK